ncbi:nitroreductase family protein [Pseudocolwellia sp. HL-MZ7]|uniref:nitroreductase family protein n=1 Tax=Pseudocolwellia sp. HL-MZ7 TaxID=3400627 RepID=UPI003CEB8AD8
MKQTITTILSVLLSYCRDIKRFTKYAHLFKPNKNKLTAQAHMYRLAHALEKGMALPQPRKGFGKSKIVQLTNFINEYCTQNGVDGPASSAASSIASLLSYHQTNEVDVESEKSLFTNLCNKFPELQVESEKINTGVLNLSKEKICKSLPESPEDFFGLRCSVRKYSDKKVSKDELLRVIKLANKTPSVCNRQSARVYVYDEKESMAKVLKHQDGNAGFGHDAGTILIVTSDLSCFYKAGERNQGYVDGGLYAMSLVYAIHSIGLGSCMLNWSQGARTDQRLRDDTNIPENEVIITMIAVGNLPDNFDVAVSPRRNVEQVASFQ